MSEVNPLGGGWGVEGPNSHTTVQAQASDWYGIQLKSEGFAESIIELERFCKANGKKLIIRDWSFVNFSKCDDNDNNPPYEFLTLKALEGKCNKKVFVFIRDAIDTWISRGMPAVNDFFFEYLQYVKAARTLDVPIFKYEDFCKNPQSVLQDICNYTGLEYRDVTQTYFHFKKLNGDVQIKGGSRGMKQGGIKKVLRKRLSKKEIIKVNNCANMIEANSLLGYSTSYHEAPLEKLWHLWIRSTKSKLRKYKIISIEK